MRGFLQKYLLVLALVCLFPAHLSAKTIFGKVVQVMDGDTIRVLDGRTAVKVHLSGVDSPEMRQPYGTEARKMTAALAAGKTVRVEYDEKDRDGCIQGVVFLPSGYNLNRELVRTGFAWSRKEGEKGSPGSLGALEEPARAARVGLWADPNPVPPWQWREKKRVRRRH